MIAMAFWSIIVILFIIYLEKNNENSANPKAAKNNVNNPKKMLPENPRNSHRMLVRQSV